MEFKLFDSVKVKENSSLRDFIGGQTGSVVSTDSAKETFEVEFANGSLNARLRINAKDLEKVS